MARMQYRIYRRQRLQRRIRRAALWLALVIAALGLISRIRSQNVMTVEPLAPPTATPLSATFDETPDSRTVTLPDRVWYALQTGIYTDSAVADAAAGQYAQRGAPGFVLEQDGKYRVLIACFGAKDDAESVRERLAERQSVDTIIHEWRCGELSMQMNGMSGQLDAVEAALSLPEDTAAQLRDLAIACDMGEYTFDEAFSAVQSMQEQLELISRTLASRFTRPYPEFITALIAHLDGACALFEPLDDCGNITDFSARLKLQSMALYRQAIDLRGLLSDM